MKRLLFSVCIVIVAGCSQGDPLDFLFGLKRNTVVLSEAALDVSSIPQTFVPSSRAEVLGKNSLVCIGLGIDKPDLSRSSQELDKLVKVRLVAVVHSADGHAYDFTCPSILLEGAYSACVSPTCRTNIPRGTEVKSVTVSASGVMHGTGAFWVSREDVGN